eukprot:SAG31_NODE_4329_length_3349_cov_14.655385_3_plen_484_part_00
MKKLGHTGEQAEHMIAEADTDGDGKINFEEFRRMNEALDESLGGYGPAPFVRSSEWDALSKSVTTAFRLEVVAHKIDAQIEAAQALVAGVEVALEPLQTAVKSGSVSAGIAPVVVATATGREARQATCCVRCGAGCVEMFCGLLVVLSFAAIGAGISFLFGQQLYTATKNQACAASANINGTQFPVKDMIKQLYCIHHRGFDRNAYSEDLRSCIAEVDRFCDGECPDLYKLLDLQTMAEVKKEHRQPPTAKEIKKAYRNAQKKWHPGALGLLSTTHTGICKPSVNLNFAVADRNPQETDCQSQKGMTCEQISHCLAEADDTLQNPEKRQLYDEQGDLDAIEHLFFDFHWIACTFMALVLGVMLGPFVLCCAGSQTCCCAGQDLGKFVCGLVVVDKQSFSPLSCSHMCCRMVSKSCFCWCSINLVQIMISAMMIVVGFVVDPILSDGTINMDLIVGMGVISLPIVICTMLSGYFACFKWTVVHN